MKKSNIAARLTTMFLVFCLLMISEVSIAKDTRQDLVSLIGSNRYQTRVISRIPKQEISILINVHNTSYYGGTPAGLIAGLLGSLISKEANKSNSINAEKRVLPLLESTTDIDFSEKYWNKLDETLRQSDWMTVTQLDKKILGLSEQEAETLAPPYLVLNTYYYLSESSQVMIVRTTAFLYINHDSKRKEKAEYWNSYTYCSEMIGNNNEKDDDAIKLWSANNAEVYRRALDEGIAQNMAMMSLDLLNTGTFFNKDTPNAVKLKFNSPFYNTTMKIKGRIINSTDNRILVRSEDGWIISLAKEQIIKEEEL